MKNEMELAADHEATNHSFIHCLDLKTLSACKKPYIHPQYIYRGGGQLSFRFLSSYPFIFSACFFYSCVLALLLVVPRSYFRSLFSDLQLATPEIFVLPYQLYSAIHTGQRQLHNSLINTQRCKRFLN